MVLSRGDLDRIITIARKSDLIIVSDEVFSPVFYGEPAPPLVSLGYQRSISTGSVSKAHGLPGIRIGWAVTPDPELMARVVTARDYTTLNVSLLDDNVGLFALNQRVLPRLLERNLSLFNESLSLIDGLVQRNPQRISWTRPSGGGTAFVKILNTDGTLVDDANLCARLTEEKGVSVIPGDYCFSEPGARGFNGYIRINLGEPQRLRNCLDTIEQFIVNL